MNKPLPIDIKVGFVGVAAAEQLLLVAFLDLITLNDGSIFVFDDSSDAPIKIVDASSPAGRQFLSRPKADPTSRAIILYGAQGPEAHLVLERPPRLVKFRSVLQRAVQMLAEAHRLANPEAGSGNSKLPLPHRFLTVLIDLLEQSSGRGWFRLRAFHELDIRVNLDRGLFSITRGGLAPAEWSSLFEGVRESIALEPVVGDPEPIVYPLETLKWQLAMQLSFGLLVPGIADRRKFSLTRWPDFAKLKASPNQMRLAALVGSRDLSIEELLSRSQVARQDLIRFLNACEICGYLRLETTDPAVAPAAPKEAAVATKVVPPAAATRPRRFQAVLGKLRAALRLNGEGRQS
ncbi:MAG: hypothetical protein AB7E72_02235 [Lysobacterales bacterium]